MSRIVYLDDVTHEIVKQYSAHNELIPMWLDLSHIPKAEQTNTAEWIIPDLVTGRYKCSHCRGNADRTTRFCPYCGYIMSNYNGKAE